MKKSRIKGNPERSKGFLIFCGRFCMVIWQLPQIVLGRLLALCLGHDSISLYRGVRCLNASWMKGGLSLGDTIFLNAKGYPEGMARTVMHEYGHIRQSRMLGWLYLIVVGIPSALWALFYNGPKEGYYRFYTEKWADRLGNVNRR